MESYSFEASLPSVDVTKDLLLDLENYLFGKGKELRGVNEEDGKETYGIIVSDQYGHLEFRRFSDYKYATYPNDTRRIVLRWYNQGDLDIRITLSREDATFKMYLKMDGARDAVHGAYEGIKRILEQYKNFNQLFFRRGIALLIALVFPIALIMLIDAYKKFESSQMLALATIVCFTGYFVSRWFKPYCVFPTRRNEQLQYWYKWFISGVVGFLIFTVGGVYLRKSLLHY